jgi:rRNA biogenesis protein RRP5
VVSLPNNLTGHVSITAVSDSLTEKLQDDAEKSDHDDDDDHESPSDDIDLKAMFSIGQYVRAYVMSTSDETKPGNAKRKIELSLRPQDANSGLSGDDVVTNCTVVASIKSVEDHGYVMEFGIENSSLRGFLSKKEVDPSLVEEELVVGCTILCVVISKKGKIAQLSALQEKIGDVSKVATEATTINTFLPGTIADVLLTEVTGGGLAGKILGHLPVTADLVHSGVGPDGTDIESSYKIGSRVKARIICTFPTATEPKLGISLLSHVLTLQQKQGNDASAVSPVAILPIGSIIEKCTVKHVESDIGLYVDIGIPGMRGFVHISRVKEGKVDALYESSGPYKADTIHRGRVVGYNAFDGIFLLSFERNIIEQLYLRLEDIPIGEVVTCTVEKLMIDEHGVSGLITKLADGITGFVPQMHLADIQLQHPEKKFKEGLKVKARVLSVNLAKRKMRLTLKKTLVNSDAPPIKSFAEVTVGTQVPGTIIKIAPNGAYIQFYGSLRGFLPISEMSEAYIRDPKEHFRVGQVVSVHILDVDADLKKLVVSCKDPTAFGLEKQTALKNISLGSVVSARVTQKTDDDIFVELTDSGLKATLPVGHLTDKSASKNSASLKRIHVGQILTELMVIDKNERRRAIILTQKPSLLAASKDGKLLCSFDNVKLGEIVHGFVRNISSTAVFIQFAGGLHAMMSRSRLPAEVQKEPDFGMRRYQTLEVKVSSINSELGRFYVIPATTDRPTKSELSISGKAETEMIEKAASSDDNLSVGKSVKVEIISVKDTQLNVKLVDDVQAVQGRIDVSQIFDEWDDIPNPKRPLQKFRTKQITLARISGVRDSKTHRFLAFSHRSTHSVLELTAKPSSLSMDEFANPTINDIKLGSTHLAFVNNITPRCLWVNISPTIRGRINATEVSDDLSLAQDLPSNFPVGSALKVRVTNVDPEKNRLDLSARKFSSSNQITWDSLKLNMVLPGKVTKVNERQVIIQLSEEVSGPIHLPDLSDNFNEATTTKYSKHDIVQVSIVDLDKSNKRLRLSTRSSRVLSSTSPVIDREITNISQLTNGDVIRGFVKNVSDKGLFVLLGGNVSALVKISNLSDRFLKEWKDDFQIDQLVKGRIISIDQVQGQVELSLKASVVDNNYIPPVSYQDIKKGQIATGSIRKVQDFGAFIVIDNSSNVSGLCHRSQMAEIPVADARKLYTEGDKVKAIVLEIDVEKKRISFGLKPSYFDTDDDDQLDEDDDGAVLHPQSDSDSDSDIDMDDEGATLHITGTDNIEDSDMESTQSVGNDTEDIEMAETPSAPPGGLGSGSYDWSTDVFGRSGDSSSISSVKLADSSIKSSKRKASEIQVDKTGQLDANGPQTVSDFERLLLGQPDSSSLWIAYMAHQMQVSDLSKAREIAERALESINIREQTEKLNVWIAYLNLEVAYGTKTRVDEVFAKACLSNDKQEVYERLASIYIQSGKHKASRPPFLLTACSIPMLFLHLV